MTAFLPAVPTKPVWSNLGRVICQPCPLSSQVMICCRRKHLPVMSARDASEEDGGIESMRSQLEGLFGVDHSDSTMDSDTSFDGTALRMAIVDRWGVQYDIQPQKRHGRVYVQVRSFHEFQFSVSCRYKKNAIPVYGIATD